VTAIEEKLPRERVEDFLSGLLLHFQSRLPDRDTIASQVARLSSPPKKWDGSEAAFIGEYVLPNVGEFLLTRVDEVQQGGDPLSLIRVGFAASEKHKSLVAVPAHPFGKIFRKPEVVYARWKDAHVPLIQSFPDFTLLSPYRILFECKYFKTRLKNPAKVQLVRDLYETFFYRALPLRPPKAKQVGWDFEYACYLAYDATTGGWLFKAWDGLPQNVRNSFWEQANIFVMILPQTQPVSQR